MKFIIDLQNEKNISKYNVDGFILNSSLYSCFNGVTFSLSDINRISKKIKEFDKLVLINLDAIIEETEIETLKEYINSLENYDYIIFSDMAILNIVSDKNKLFYNPNTLVASSYEKSIFDKMKIRSFIANELSEEELKSISVKTDINMMVYGYHQMMYSFRPLLSLYNEFINGDKDLVNKLLYLKEELREDKYLVYQSTKGTFVYTSYIYAAFKELLSFKDKLNFIRFNGAFIEEEKMIKVIELYHKLFALENVDKLYQELKELESNVDSGFLKKSSILLKGANNE